MHLRPHLQRSAATATLRALCAFVRGLAMAAAVVLFAGSATEALAAGIYAQLVVNFPAERTVSYEYEKAENTLVVAFAKTSPSELGAFDHYDERLIKRVLMKDLGPSGTEVRIVLRDRGVRALVSKFTEPFRVAIDLFDASYEEERDPTTGLPLVTGAAHASAAAVGDGGDIDGAALQFVAPEGSAATDGRPAAPHENTGKRRLLQATPPVFEAETELQEALRNTADGAGKAWATYPPYVYRLQTASYEEGPDRAGQAAKDRRDAPSLAQAMTSAKAMADVAAKLFDFGHENRALVVYQQVLHRDPTIFDKDALHLWKLAETHLGQGNLTLARGYYQALIEKHPQSPLAHFARLRVLDVNAIRMLSQGRAADLATLLPGLDAIKPRHVGELQAQLAIRRAFWTAPADSGVAGLPPIDGAVRADLAASYTEVEGARTAFLAASLLLADMLRLDTAWQRPTGPFADAYFKRFSGPPTEVYRAPLRDRLSDKLNKNLQGKAADGKLVEAIGDYEALPGPMRSISKTPATAWALAESYRKLGQADKAVDLYAVAAKAAADGPERFKAQFWLAVTAGELAAQDGKGARASRLREMSREADKAAGAVWQRLKDPERQQLATIYKDPFEKAVTGAARLRTPARIVLSSWTKALATPAAAASGAAPTDWQRQFSPSGSAVILLTDLSKRFSELGMTTERRQAIGLLKQMKPSQFEDDKAAKQIWSRELVKLAEDYRSASDYLEAGRLYSLVGSESQNWEGRAEVLYKGGLLLYRAGRRDEALAAFKQAGADGNNLFYANLAKERLSQLE